jgi:hypothetical protein
LYNLACKCLMLDEQPQGAGEIAEILSSGKVSLENFIFFCDGHLALPAVYKKLKDNKLLELFPSDFAAHLNEIYEMNRTRNEGIIRQAEDIAVLFHRNNFTPVFLKGTAFLLDKLYTDPGERLASDIDLLVSENDYLKAAEILMNSGYENHFRFFSDVKMLKHYPRLFRKDVPADVEIHRLPVNTEYAKVFSSELIFRHKKSIPGKTHCYVPDDTHKIVHNFIHSQLSNSGYRYRHISLRDLYDLFLLSKRAKPETALPFIEERIKAEGYFLFSAKMTGLKDDFFITENKEAKRRVTQLSRALKYPRISLFVKTMMKLYDLIFKRYLGRILKATFQKSSRQYIRMRLSDPHWYKLHLKGLKKYFTI